MVLCHRLRQRCCVGQIAKGGGGAEGGVPPVPESGNTAGRGIAVVKVGRVVSGGTCGVLDCTVYCCSQTGHSGTEGSLS